jgi:hypothetical protein
LQVLLESKFGGVSDGVYRRLEQLQNPERLQSLLVKIPGSPSLDDFESLLGS